MSSTPATASETHIYDAIAEKPRKRKKKSKKERKKSDYSQPLSGTSEEIEDYESLEDDE